MKITLISVGRASRLLRPAIREFETRAGRYWKLDTIEVSAGKASRNRPVAEVMAEEAEAIRAAAPAGTELVALTRTGSSWSSRDLASYLNQLAIGGGPGAAFVIGGAYGLDGGLIREARHELALSAMTFPHDLARLVFAEQLYRAGTIVRGEPYHKGKT